MDLDDDAGPGPDGGGLATLGDLERSRRFSRRADGLRWLRARAALRLVLSSATGDAPRDLPLASAVGKPRLPGGPRFNLAHAGARAVVAVAPSLEVGVDVEVERPGRRELDVLAKAVGDEAVARWSALPPPERTAAFYAEWVRFEAAVKCRGATVAGSLRRDVAAGLTVSPVDAGPGYAAAVALDGVAGVETRSWRWPRP